jgi:hypothetical protein
VLPRRGVRTGLPEQRLVEGPGADEEDGVRGGGERGERGGEGGGGGRGGERGAGGVGEFDG